MRIKQLSNDRHKYCAVVVIQSAWQSLTHNLESYAEIYKLVTR